MCVLKICMPVFSVSHLISRHFKWSISLLCGWSFLIPVIRVFPVFSTELIFCTSYNWIFSSVRFFFFFLILVFIPSIVFLSVAQDFVVLL